MTGGLLQYTSLLQGFTAANSNSGGGNKDDEDKEA
jgi:hypothetical protein